MRVRERMTDLWYRLLRGPLVVFLVADYAGDHGDTGDMAYGEVTSGLLRFLHAARVERQTVRKFDTLAGGMQVAVLALNPGPRRVIYHNVDDRDKAPKGSRLARAFLPDGTLVVGPNAGYMYSFLRDAAVEIRYVNAPYDTKDQFRSRAWADVVARLARGDVTLVGERVPDAEIPAVPESEIAYVDGYGNCKTTLCVDGDLPSVGDEFTISVNGRDVHAIRTDGLFVGDPNRAYHGGEPMVRLYAGSTQWRCLDGAVKTFMELCIRGGDAWSAFGRPDVGDRTITFSDLEDSQDEQSA